MISELNQNGVGDITHVFSGLITGILLIVVGVITLFRNRNNRVNQAFLGFLTGIGLYFCIDSSMFIYSEFAFDILNLLRDLSICCLIIGLSLGAFATIIIQYGKSTAFNPRILIPWVIGSVLLVGLGIIGDSLMSGSDHHADAHFEYSRLFLGWIGITGSMILFSLIITVNLLMLIRDSTADFRIRLLKILAGFIIIISLLLIFDIGFTLEVIESLIENLIIHISMHLGIIIGSILILNAFWSPLTE